MKRKILIVLGVVLLIVGSVFSGVFYEDFGLIRGLRAKHLLAITPEMLTSFRELSGPINMKIEEIEAQYEKDLAALEATRDKARNDFFDLPKKTRDTSEEGILVKYTYLDAVYKIVILENQKNLEVATLQVDRYTKGWVIRSGNI